MFFANFDFIYPPPMVYMVGKPRISASIWHQAIKIWCILQAVRISVTDPDRLLNSSWHCVLCNMHPSCEHRLILEKGCKLPDMQSGNVIRTIFSHLTCYSTWSAQEHWPWWGGGLASCPVQLHSGLPLTQAQLALPSGKLGLGTWSAAGSSPLSPGLTGHQLWPVSPPDRCQIFLHQFILDVHMYMYMRAHQFQYFLIVNLFMT